MTPQPRARKYDPDADVITRSDTVASPLRSSEDAPSSGFGRRKPQAPRELQPYTARLTEPELLPTSDDPTVVDKGLARLSITPPRAADDRVSLTPSRMSVTSSRLSVTPSRLSVTPSRMSLTPSLAAPRVPDPRWSPAPFQDPNAAVPPTGRARGVDYGPWLLVLGTTLAAAVIGAALGYVTRPNGESTPPPPAVTRPAPRATAAQPATPPAEPTAARVPTPPAETPSAASSVPVIRLGELPVDATTAPEPSAEAAPTAAPAPARRAPAPRPAARHR